MHKCIDGGGQADDGELLGKEVNLQDPINLVCD